MKRSDVIVGLVVALCAACLYLLHGHVLRYPFISDDYFFLWETRTGGLGRLFSGLGVQRNYYRPLGREVYFWLVATLGGERPLVFHLVGFVLLVVVVALVFALARRLAGTRAAALAAVVYALLYPHRVLLSWASCAQDLLAACLGTAAAIAFWSGRVGLASGAFLLALLCKESVAPLPLVLAAWAAAGAPPGASPVERLRTALRRTWPLFATAAAWAALVAVVRSVDKSWNSAGVRNPWADIVLTPAAAWEGFRGTALAVLYADQPFARLGEALGRTPLPWAAAALAAAAAALAFALPGARKPEVVATRGPAGADAAWLGLLWFVIAALPLGLVGHHYSAYYVTFAAIGFAIVAGALLARATPWLAVPLVVAAVWLDAGANATRTFRAYEDVVGVSDFTAARMEHVARYLGALERALRADPPPRGARVTISQAPRLVAFSTGGDRALWVWFGDSTMSLEYLTRYRRGDERPRRFLRWDEGTHTFSPLSPAFVDAVVEGEEALAAGEAELAQEALERALALSVPGRHDAERVELYVELGAACRRRNDLAGARRAWTQALAIDPRHRTALLNLTALAGSEGRFDEARGWVSRALAAEPDRPEALLLLARVERARGQFGAAHEAWLRLQMTHRSFADSMARLGEGY